MTSKKRSEAAKKAAKTRKENEAKAEQEENGAKESQEEPREDSNLTTPQPDQPAPTEVERREGESRKDDSDSKERSLEDEQASDSTEKPEKPEQSDEQSEQPRTDDGEQPDEQEGQPRQQPQPEPPDAFTKHVNDGGRSYRADVLVGNHVDLEKRRQEELASARERHNLLTAGVIGVPA